MPSPTESLAAIIVRVAELAETGDPPSAEDREDLMAYVRLRTIEAERMDEDEQLVEAGDEYPGYLRREAAGAQIFVPFNLAPVFPGDRTLSPAVEIGRNIILAKENALCISGSTTFLGQIETVGDLDFCEYYLNTPSNLSADLLLKLNGAGIPLVCVKCAGNEFRAPWPDISAHILDVFPEGANKPPRLKLDFVSKSPLGVLPTTSIVLLTSTGEDLAASQSFAYQEAVVVGAGPVRGLISPERLGTYVTWLRKEIRSLLDGTHSHRPSDYPIKALKRCLSLLLMIARYEDVNHVLNELSKTALKEIVLDIRLNELRRIASELAEDYDWLLHEIEALDRGAISISLEDREEALSAAAQLAAALLLDLDRSFEEVA
jgi:hypothetical protein